MSDVSETASQPEPEVWAGSTPISTRTPVLGLAKPPDDSSDWGGDYREAMDKIDAFAGTVQTGQDVRTLFDWTSVGGESVPAYVGTAAPGIDPMAVGWIIKKFTWQVGPSGSPEVVAIDVATGIWADRLSLF